MATLESLDIKIETLVGNLDKKIDVLIEKLDVKFETLDERLESLDLKFEEKIDDLAAMTAQGFAELRGEFKGDMLEVIDRLEVIEDNYTTKDDLAKFGKNVDIMLDKHIGVFRKDYDELAMRTKNIEKAVFATS